MSLSLEEQLKQLKTEKGIISGKFKHLEKGSAEHLAQLEQMRAISEQIKALEATLKGDKAGDPPPPKTTGRQAPFVTVNPQQQWNQEFSYELVPFPEGRDWFRFIAQHPASTPSHAIAWAEVIAQSFGHQSYVLIARAPSGEVLGGLPFTVINSPFFGRFGVSMPYLNYGGPVSSYADVLQGLMDELARVRTSLSLKHIEVRSMQAGLGDEPSTKKVSMVLPLPSTEEQLEAQLGSKLRAQYKKAEEHNPVCKIGKLELLDDFYRVFAHNMRDLGTPVYSKRWFAGILQNKGLTSHLVVIYVDSKPVSAGFLVTHGQLMEIPWASTLKSANRWNTNMWMYRKILGFAIAQQCAFFDFGRSTEGAGTYKFKKQWGAEPYPHYWYTVLPDGQAKPELNPDNPKLKLFVALWKWLPVWLTRLIGPTIIKDIP